MTLEEAKDNYMFCNGNEGYIMWHELGQKACKEFSDLNISREIKAEWDREIIEKYLEAFTSSPSNPSGWLDNVLEALERGYCETQEYAKRLLDELEKLEDIDELEKIHIIRRMGEDTQFRMSGCRFYCRKTPYMERMNAIVHKLMDFECPDEKADPRFEKSPSKLKLYNEAVERYEKSYSEWSTKKEII